MVIRCLLRLNHHKQLTVERRHSKVVHPELPQPVAERLLVVQQVVPLPEQVPAHWPPTWRLRHRAGDFNALGRLKFVLPNNEAIYLHHTNQPGLFRQAKRAYSSGCIRVEAAYTLADRLLFDHPGWRQALDSGQWQKITLSQPLPVALVYWTAWVDASGHLHFRDDIYGLDLGPDSQFALHKD